VVLALARDWTVETERAQDLDAIRAGLRGLGTTLLIVARDGVWSFRPDDAPERLAAGPVVFDEPLERITKGSTTGERCVFVFGSGAALRFARDLPDDVTSLGGGIAAALSTAVQAMRTPRVAPVLSRRELVVASLVAGFVVVLGNGCKHRDEAPTPTAGPVPAAPPTPTNLEVTLQVNGSNRTVTIDPRTSLLDALRERMGLTGTKKGCDHGQCGACTVLLDGRRVLSCLTLAIAAQGPSITTIEGLARGEDLHPMQEAFIHTDGLQCGYCTPGQIMSAVGLLAEGHATTDDDIREQMSGNICRCGAYPNIVAAVQLARKRAS
jgi:xanthine dehydrogenase YagT iron-sulfur-binding subunit